MTLGIGFKTIRLSSSIGGDDQCMYIHVHAHSCGFTSLTHDDISKSVEYLSLNMGGIVYLVSFGSTV